MNTPPLKGVNLGGWLIVEKWMTPSLFKGTDAIDEYTLSQSAKGRELIAAHRKTFITEEDFVWLHANAVDAIRVPVGYWVFESDDSLVPHAAELDWALRMAQKYNLKVLIDLHGHKGSQNGYDHSGKIGKAGWFKDASHRINSLKVLKQIALKYKDHPQFWGIQLINEPKVGLFHFKLRKYYRQAELELRDILHPETRIIFSDGFTPRLLSGALRKARHAVVMDIHLYHSIKFWTRFTGLSLYYKTLPLQKKLLGRLSKHQDLIIGEWSGVFRQRTFNQYPVSQHPTLIKEHVRRQLDSFSPALAWFYWSYKTEKPGVWSYRSLVEDGTFKEN